MKLHYLEFFQGFKKFLYVYRNNFKVAHFFKTNKIMRILLARLRPISQLGLFHTAAKLRFLNYATFL